MTFLPIRSILLAGALSSGLLLSASIKAQSWTQIGSTMNGEAAFDNSGYSLAMTPDGSTVIIGAPGNDGAFSSGGQARVYSYNGSNWIQKGIDIDGEAQYESLGDAVAIDESGTIIAVSAIAANSSAGQVKVYEWSGSAWIQKGTYMAGNASSSEFGTSVAMSADGNTIVVGASKDDQAASNAGQVKVFEWSGTDWVQKGSSLNGDAANDAFGQSVDISYDGNTIVIGAPLNLGGLTNGGQMKVFEWSGSAWTQKGSDLYGESSADRFGYSVSMDSTGTNIAVGAFWNSGNGSKSGHARVFTWSGSAWTQKGTDIDGEAYDDNSGNAIALNGDGTRIAVGAKGNDGIFGTNAVTGQVRVHSWNGSSWNQVGSDIDGESGSDYFGQAVAISADGDIVAGAAHWNSNNGTSSGDVRVFGTTTFSSVATIGESKVSVYPNPSSGIFQLNTQELITSIEIYSVEGKLIHRSSTLNSYTIDLFAHPAGLYYLSVTNAFGEVEMIVLEKL